MAAVCIRQNKMNLPAVNIQTDSGADVMTFLQVGPGSALRTCLLYKYKLTTVYQYKCTFRDEKKDTNRESSGSLGSCGVKYCKTTARKVWALTIYLSRVLCLSFVLSYSFLSSCHPVIFAERRAILYV